MVERSDVNALAKAAKPMSQRIKLAVRRAVLRMVDDSAGMQRVQVEALKGDPRDRVEHPQEYGFSSHPLPGATTHAFAIGGATADTVVLIIADRRYRLKAMAAGEVAIHDDQGQTIHIKRDGIDVNTPFKVTVNAGEDVTVNAGGMATVKAEGVARLEGEAVEIHAMSSLRLDCGGYGETWQPTGRLLWTQGTPTTQMGPPQPPEHQP